MSDGDLGPGVRRLRPDDHFMVLAETDATPMQIGSLLYLEVPEPGGEVFERLRDHLAGRLGYTPLLAVLREAPESYDSDVWIDVASIDLDDHVERVSLPMDDVCLRAFVAEKAMQRLDLAKAPFRIVIFDNLRAGQAAIYMCVHHSITDGVGFQTLLGLLSDERLPRSARRTPGAPPSPEAWRILADARFEAEADLREARRAQMHHALAVLRSGTLPRRAETPVLKLSGPTSGRRVYSTISLPLDRVKAVGKKLNGTVNDIFLAMVATALRRYLIEIDDLPGGPITVNSARSYRRPEHGDFGNRIVAMHPHLATDVAGAVDRLRAIQASMAAERARTAYDEAMLDAPEKPFGPRERRARFAARSAGGAAVLPGNVTLSNVPGPAGERSFAGYRQSANYPVPLLGSGRFLNVTSRRNGGHLDMGVMADPDKITDIDLLTLYLVEALEAYEGI
jgi:WS/DGAT/MGAT family acyltransferase